jgi:hypothetical protein
MPDYYEIPNSVTEYNEKNHGNVFGGATDGEAKGHEKEAKH